VRSAYQTSYERRHCHAACKKFTPCLMADPSSISVNEVEFCASTDRSRLPKEHKCSEAYGVFTETQLEPVRQANSKMWAGGTLHITGPVADGFWVRVLVVLAHAQFARHLGLPVAVAYSSPADAYDSNNNHELLLDSGRGGVSLRHERRGRRDGWSQYFERIDLRETSLFHGSHAALRSATPPQGVKLQLGCHASARVWEQYSNYAPDFAFAAQQRAGRMRSIAELPIRPRSTYVRQVGDHRECSASVGCSVRAARGGSEDA
jgi:hypothetical protein